VVTFIAIREYCGTNGTNGFRKSLFKFLEVTLLAAIKNGCLFFSSTIVNGSMEYVPILGILLMPCY